MRIFLVITVFALLAGLCHVAEVQAGTPSPDDLLLDATFVPCSDSTESLFIFRDGRAIYAYLNQGITFSIAGPLLSDLESAITKTSSITSKKHMDSCSTIGVILDGPRYLLINGRNPAPPAREFRDRVEQLRKFARRKLGSMERLTERAETAADTTIMSEPSIEADSLRQFLYESPIAQEWRCRGNVLVTAYVDSHGKVRQAYVERAAVRGKCASLLSMTALHAALLATFEPAKKKNGKPAAGWKRVEVDFAGGKPGTR